jgi:hypothetical protein
MHLKSCFYVFFSLFIARLSYAADCSQKCFTAGSPDGSLDPNVVSDPKLFRYRASHSCRSEPPSSLVADPNCAAAIVLGNFLYIDGGIRMYTPNNTATRVPGTLYPLPTGAPISQLTSLDLYTYSIDLSVGWNNQTVSLNRIDKTGVPLLNAANLWKDPSNTSFYAYNGELTSSSYDVGPPENELWQFTPSGNSGTWTNVGVSAQASSNFTKLLRVTNAASTYGNGVAYALGGYQNWRTSFKAPFYQNGGITHIDMPVSGLVSFDMGTGSWSNITSASFTESGSFARGQLQYVPGYGASGLLIPLGGSTSTALDNNDGHTILNDFATISMYHIASGTWHTQATSGDVPSGRQSFCSVGVQGDNGTFEVSTFDSVCEKSADEAARSSSMAVTLSILREIPTSTQFTCFHFLPFTGGSRATNPYKRE